MPTPCPSSILPGALLVLASACAWGTPPASPAALAAAASAPAASAACPARTSSASQRADRRTSKLRHALDEDDPCADSRGLGAPIRRLAPASGPISLQDSPARP